jgi:hypothetical protein
MANYVIVEIIVTQYSSPAIPNDTMFVHGTNCAWKKLQKYICIKHVQTLSFVIIS